MILSIDIGGTFTDVVLLDEHSSELAVAKVLTSSPDPSQGVLEGVGTLLETQRIDAAEISRTIHGTTLVTNALIERKGARTGLLTTEGFRDALEIGREGRYDIYDLSLQLPEPLVERRLRLEVGERLKASGEVLRPLDEDSLRAACRELVDAGVEAVAICFLHSYANSAHERRAAEVVGELLPDVALSVSHEVAPELREYERTSTTVANAYVRPLACRYLTNLEEGLRQRGVGVPLHIMLSTGGICSAATAADFPIRLVESGPCGGALAAAHTGRLAGSKKVLAFDMGGTTAKAVLATDGEVPITTESEVARVYRFKRGSGLPLLVPVLDMIEIGAGGGSIAHLNALGLPVVGPESAGSSPGPACYGAGGTRPTVTDADLIAGYLSAEYFLGGEMALDLSAARRSMETLAAALGEDENRTAWGVHQLVNENMANAARVHAAERGIDIRVYDMVATGGAGPVHACGVAERLGIEKVIVPRAAGVASALGLMMAPIAFDFSRSYVRRLDEVDMARVSNLYKEMEDAGREIVSAAGVAVDGIRISRTADMRYVGQGHEIRVEVPAGQLDDSHRAILQSAFDRAYRGLYGRVCEGVSVEAIHWRATVSGPKPEQGFMRTGQRDRATPRDDASGGGSGSAEKHGGLKGKRAAIFAIESGPVEVPVFDRYALREGFRASGPVIIEEAESTSVVPPGWAMRVEAALNLVVTRESI